MFEFMTTIGMAIVATIAICCFVGLFGFVMSGCTAILFAVFPWAYTRLYAVYQMQNLEPCGERLVRNDVTSYHGWVKRCFLIFAIIWILFGLYYAATGTDEITKDTRHWATMGYTEPSDRLKPQLPVVTVGTEIRRYRLVTYNPPKHLYVTIKDLEANVTYESLYVSKHCNNHTLN